MLPRPSLHLLLAAGLAAVACAQVPIPPPPSAARPPASSPVVPAGSARVTVHAESGFAGESLEFAPGTDVPSLNGRLRRPGRSWNDSISSLRLPPGVRVVVYSDSNYRGDALELDATVPDLAAIAVDDAGIDSWDDRISSLRVLPAGAPPQSGPTPPPATTPTQPGFGPGWPGTAPVSPVPAPPDNTVERQNPDAVTRRAFDDFLARAPTSEEYRTYRRRILDQGWTEAQIRQEVRRSDEFRRSGADRIIARAYRELLGREPDPSGLDSLRRRMIDRGWGDEEVRSTIRASDEFRRREARRIVESAYRELLGREPDEAGYRNWENNILNRGYDEGRVRRDIMRSPEYQERLRNPPPPPAAPPSKDKAPVPVDSKKPETGTDRETAPKP